CTHNTAENSKHLARDLTMGNWYRVTKRIHGRLYDYWQRTERRGKQVKTFNKYIGPHSSLGLSVVFAASSDRNDTTSSQTNAYLQFPTRSHGSSADSAS